MWWWIHLSPDLQLTHLKWFVQLSVWSIDIISVSGGESATDHERKGWCIFICTCFDFEETQMFLPSVPIFMFCLVAIFVLMLYDACDLSPPSKSPREKECVPPRLSSSNTSQCCWDGHSPKGSIRLMEWMTWISLHYCSAEGWRGLKECISICQLSPLCAPSFTQPRQVNGPWECSKTH